MADVMLYYKSKRTFLSSDQLGFIHSTLGRKGERRLGGLAYQDIKLIKLANSVLDHVM